jgi:hypothetical protein
VVALAGLVLAQPDDPPSPPPPLLPCPPFFEHLCDAPTPPGGGEPLIGFICACGPGGWVRFISVDRVTVEPSMPQTQSGTTHFLGVPIFSYSTLREASANRGYCEAHVTGITNSIGGSGSRSCSASASYDHSEMERWVSSAAQSIPCGRYLLFVAHGSAGIEITASCSAAPGTSASCSGNVSSSCSSRGDASAELTNQGINGSVAYNTTTQGVHLNGHIGAEMVPYSSASVNGAVSAVSSSQVMGNGSISGTATFIVLTCPRKTDPV